MTMTTTDDVHLLDIGSSSSLVPEKEQQDNVTTKPTIERRTTTATDGDANLLLLDLSSWSSSVPASSTSEQKLQDHIAVKKTTTAEAVAVATGEEEIKDVIDIRTNRYEKLIGALPFPRDYAEIIIAGARLGLLHETLALCAIIYNIKNEGQSIIICGNCNNNNQNIYHDRTCKSSSGSSSKQQTYNKLLENFYSSVLVDDEISIGIANLSAYMFWDYTWNNQRRRKNCNLFEYLVLEGCDDSKTSYYDCNLWEWNTKVGCKHIKFCMSNGIDPISVMRTYETVHQCMKSFYQSHEPNFIKCNPVTPTWTRHYLWKAEPLLHHNSKKGKDMVYQVYGNDTSLLSHALHKLFDGGSGGINSSAIHNALMPAMELVATTSGKWKDATVVVAEQQQQQHHQQLINKVLGKRFHRYIQKTITTIKANARPSRSLFHCGTSIQKGSQDYSFECDPDSMINISNDNNDDGTENKIEAIAPIIHDLILEDGPMKWFEEHSGSLLILGESSDYTFTKSLKTLGYEPRASSVLKLYGNSTANRRIVMSRLRGVDATRIHCNKRVLGMVISGQIHCYAWNFPQYDTLSTIGIGSRSVNKKISVDNFDRNDDKIHESLILGAFHSLGALYDSSVDYEAPVSMLQQPFLLALTLHSDQFSRWAVLRSCERTGWRLKSWCKFQYQDFPGYVPKQNNGDRIQTIKNQRFYVFQYRDAYSDLYDRLY